MQEAQRWGLIQAALDGEDFVILYGFYQTVGTT